MRYIIKYFLIFPTNVLAPAEPSSEGQGLHLYYIH
jgi:hypothetical protein